MLRCPECGSMVQDGNDFCPHCGRNLDSADQITEEEFQAYTQPRRRIPWFLIICCAMLMLPSLFGIFGFHDPPDPSYGPMDRTVTWEVHDYNQGSGSPLIETFEITYTVDENELKKANASNIYRQGSQLRERDAQGHVAVSDYVVVGNTVNRLSYELWHKYSAFVETHPAYNTPAHFANYLAAFVQTAVVYTDDVVEHPVGEYWNYPVETLYSLKGDCEDSSILLCAIYSAMTAIVDSGDDYMFSPHEYIEGACCFGMPGHFMTGVNLPVPLVRDDGDLDSSNNLPVHSYDDNGDIYYFCETTGELTTVIFPIGYIPGGCLSLADVFPGYVNTYFMA